MLDENAVDEGAGLGGPMFSLARIGPLPARIVSAYGPLDIDGDGAIGGAPIAWDLNHVSASDRPSPGQLLHGSNDWEQVVRAGFCAAMRSAAWREPEEGACSASVRVADGEPAPEVVSCGVGIDEAQALREAPLALDCNGNGIDDELDRAAARSDVNGDGVRDLADYAAIEAALDLDLQDPAFPAAGDLEPDGIITRADLTAWAREVLAAPACSNGIDDDGAVDWPEDPGCESAFGGLEDPACDDGVDNDGDGLVDAEDESCAPGRTGSESPPPVRPTRRHALTGRRPPRRSRAPLASGRGERRRVRARPARGRAARSPGGRGCGTPPAAAPAGAGSRCGSRRCAGSRAPPGGRAARPRPRRRRAGCAPSRRRARR